MQFDIRLVERPDGLIITNYKISNSLIYLVNPDRRAVIPDSKVLMYELGVNQEVSNHPTPIIAALVGRLSGNSLVFLSSVIQLRELNLYLESGITLKEMFLADGTKSLFWLETDISIGEIKLYGLAEVEKVSHLLEGI